MHLMERLRAANGWQRIWIVVAGCLFIVHLTILGFVLADKWAAKEQHTNAALLLSERYADVELTKQECAVAGQAIAEAKKTHEEIRAEKLREIALKRQALESTGQELQTANSRLDTLRVLQLENQQRTLQRQVREMDAVAAKYPYFSYETHEPRHSRTLHACAKRDADRMLAVSGAVETKKAWDEAPGQMFSAVLLTMLSWLLFSAGIYGAGWLAGWIFKGFKRPPSS